MSGGPEEMRQRIDAWAAQVQAKAESYRALTAEMDKITDRGEAGNGAIRVTVDRNGAPVNIELTDDVRTMRPNHLAGELMTAFRKAQSTLGDQVVGLMQEKVPDDTASIAAMADNYARQFPAEPDEAAEPSSPPRHADDDDEDFSSRSFLR